MLLLEDIFQNNISQADLLKTKMTKSYSKCANLTIIIIVALLCSPLTTPAKNVNNPINKQENHDEYSWFISQEPGSAVESELDESKPNRPVLGLVLSGGGAKGIAHIGVLKILEEANLEIEVITGTSMGAVVGGLYSIGYSAAELESIFVNTDWTDIFDDTPSRRSLAMEQKFYDSRYTLSLPIKGWDIELPTGVIPGQKISNKITELTWPVHDIENFSDFPVPFACVATDLENGEPVVLNRGFLSEAIRASMSIPSLMTPVWIEDKLLIDGYIARNLPATDAIDLGAEFIIGVDVGTPLQDVESINDLWSITNQTMAFQSAEENTHQRYLCDILIEPALDDVAMHEFGRVEEIIEIGENAAINFLPRLRALADSLKSIGRGKPVYKPISPDTIYVSSIEIEGLDKTPLRLVKTQLGIKKETWIARSEIQRSVERVYSTQFFERVTYRLEATPDGTILHFKLIEKNPNTVRFGFHYDSDDKAAVIFNLTRHNLGLQGSMAVADVRLGNISGSTLSYFVHTGIQPRLGIRLQLNNYESDFIFNKEPGVSIPYDHNSSSTELFVGSIFSTTTLFGIGLAAISDNFNAINPPEDDNNESDIKQEFFSWFAIFWYDTLDRINFPRSGLFIEAAYNQSLYDQVNNKSFILRDFTAQANVPVSSRFTIQAAVTLGSLTHDDFTIFPGYSAGGIDSFLGAKSGQLAGDTKQIGSIAVQWETWNNRFVVLEGNIGRVRDEWSLEFDGKDVEAGAGLTIGILTRFGPIQFTSHWGTVNESISHLRIGYMF